MTASGAFTSRPPVLTADDDQRWWFVLDPVLITSVFLITGLGAVLVFSATRGPSSRFEPLDYSFLERQVAFAVFGLILAVVVAHVDVRRIRQLLPAAYLTLIALLGGLLVFGADVRGARAWYTAGGQW